MKLKSLGYRLIGKFCPPRLSQPRTDRGDAVSIICLHGVHDATMEKVAPPPTSSISALSLKSNLRALARYHTVVSMSEAVAMLRGRVPWRPRCAVLTFDDSLACTLNVAAPILQDMRMTATVFISTEIIETRRPYWWLRLDFAWHNAKRIHAEIMTTDGAAMLVERGNLPSLRKIKSILRQMPAIARDAAVDSVEQQFGTRLEEPASQYPYAAIMTWEDARKLVELGFAVGSHTVSHPNLALITPDEARRELVESKATIEHQTGAQCQHFCYPYGSFNDTVVSLCVEAGYEASTSTIAPGENRLGQNMFTLRRYSMPSCPWKLGSVLSGFPAFFASLRMTFASRKEQAVHILRGH
jgi:peptidoglycan/xylan/chitin deacetylase (PgdA/CDA1 family)